MYNVRCMTLIRTQINLEENQYRLLTLEAQRQNRSLSDIVRETVDKKFNLIKKKGNAGALLELAKQAVSFQKYNKNIPKDLIEHMDEYLYGKKSGDWKILRKKSSRIK